MKKIPNVLSSSAKISKVRPDAQLRKAWTLFVSFLNSLPHSLFCHQVRKLLFFPSHENCVCVFKIHQNVLVEIVPQDDNKMFYKHFLSSYQ